MTHKIETSSAALEQSNTNLYKENSAVIKFVNRFFTTNVAVRSETPQSKPSFALGNRFSNEQVYSPSRLLAEANTGTINNLIHSAFTSSSKNRNKKCTIIYKYKWG